jgi:hypothetical protein
MMQHLRNGHFDGAIVLDDNDAAGDGDFAVGESVKGVNQLSGADAAGGADFNLDFFGRKIVDALDFDFALARGVLDGFGERLGRGGGRNLGNDDGGIVAGLDASADLNLPRAVAVFAGVHEAAGLKVREDFERLLFENSDLSFEQFREIVR